MYNIENCNRQLLEFLLGNGSRRAVYSINMMMKKIMGIGN
jgi:hypothetical protein